MLRHLVRSAGILLILGACGDATGPAESIHIRVSARWDAVLQDGIIPEFWVLADTFQIDYGYEIASGELAADGTFYIDVREVCFEDREELLLGVFGHAPGAGEQSCNASAAVRCVDEPQTVTDFRPRARYNPVCWPPEG